MPWLLYPREITPSTHWIGGWVGPRAVLDAVVKRKIPSPSPQESDPKTSIVQPATQHYTIYHTIPYHTIYHTVKLWHVNKHYQGDINLDCLRTS